MLGGRRLALVAIFILCSLQSETFSEQTPYVRHQNLVYEVRNGVGLILDVFVPTGEKNGLGIIDTLSGGWYSDQGQVKDHFRAKVFDTFCAHGYTVFMIRPGSQSLFTAKEMVRNLKKGIQWVKVHSGDYGVDPNRLGMMGASAGGHLTLLATVTADKPDPNADKPEKKMGTAVEAVAVFFPPTDFLDWGSDRDIFDYIKYVLFRCGFQGKTEEEIREAAAEISPARLVKEKLPPILLIHGDADPRVPLHQSELMVEALKKVGSEVRLIVKEGGAHPWPTIYEEVEVMADWFDERLKP